MIDSSGYRPNVGIILSNTRRQVFLARRCGQNAWQFPQGGIDMEESPQEAMFRELYEETGLLPDHVEIMGRTSEWLRYNLPKRYVRRNQHPVCIGQKQIWYMLRMTCPETQVNLATTTHPEFDRWRWVNYWAPIRKVIYFKRRVYREALKELRPLVFPVDEAMSGSD
ncbi:MAG: RNA pyrophosphohydrolase [Pseudomonadota bacterium]